MHRNLKFKRVGPETCDSQPDKQTRSAVATALPSRAGLAVVHFSRLWFLRNDAYVYNSKEIIPGKGMRAVQIDFVKSITLKSCVIVHRGTGQCMVDGTGPRRYGSLQGPRGRHPCTAADVAHIEHKLSISSGGGVPQWRRRRLTRRLTG